MEILNKKPLLLILVTVVLFLTFFSWKECVDFKDFIKLSSINIPLHLEDLVHTDTGMNPLMVRAFHNKVIDFFLIVLRKYLLFFDIRFGINLFSIVGYAGLMSAVYFVSINWKKLSLLFKSYIIFALILPLIQIIFEPHMRFDTRIVIFYVVYSGLIVYGLSNILKKGTLGKVALLVLIFLSVWWLLAMKSEVANYCIGIASGLK